MIIDNPPMTYSLQSVCGVEALGSVTIFSEATASFWGRLGLIDKMRDVVDAKSLLAMHCRPNLTNDFLGHLVHPILKELPPR
jgi:hypothetical protein